MLLIISILEKLMGHVQLEKGNCTIYFSSVFFQKMNTVLHYAASSGLKRCVEVGNHLELKVTFMSTVVPLLYMNQLCHL